MRAVVTRIEQAIARGLTASQVMDLIGVDYETYRSVHGAMEAASRLTDHLADAEAYALSLGRSLSSCYGPAPASVISALVAELNSTPCPYQPRDGAGRYIPKDAA